MSRVVVDDRSKRISYRGVWTGGISGETRATHHYTFEEGATISFDFHGTGIYVYGDIVGGEGQVVRMDFQLDDAAVFSTSRTSNSPEDIYNVVWYQSTGFASKNHTIVMTYRGSTAAGVDDMMNPFHLDRVEYIETPYTPPAPSNPTANPSTPQTSNGYTPSPSGPVSPPQSTSKSSSHSFSGSSAGPEIWPSSGSASNTPSNSSSSTTLPRQSGSRSNESDIRTLDPRPTGGHSSDLPIGPIVGGAIGGLLAVILFTIILILIQRDRQRKKGLKAEAKDIPTAVFPFNVYINRTTRQRPLTLVNSSTPTHAGHPPNLQDSVAFPFPPPAYSE